MQVIFPDGEWKKWIFQDALHCFWAGSSMQSHILTCFSAGLREPPSVDSCKQNCSKASLVFLCRTSGFVEPGWAYIQKSSKAYFILPCLWFLFLALVHSKEIETKTQDWLYFQVGFNPNRGINKKLKFKFKSLF